MMSDPKDNIRFIDLSWTNFERVNGKWTFAGISNGKGLQIGGKVFFPDGSHKLLSGKNIKIKGVYDGIPSWANKELLSRYNEALGIIDLTPVSEKEKDEKPKSANTKYSENLDIPFPTDDDAPPVSSSSDEFYDFSLDAPVLPIHTEISLSDEQELFVRKALSGKNVLVDACIGSGKTTAIQQLCNRYPASKKILYLTYNKLLKLDAKTKIRMRNVTVTNYHGFAYSCLQKAGLSYGISDLVTGFNRKNPPIPHFDVLVIDEYQDIEKELAVMLDRIKAENPGIQVIAVGDMAQKIYDKTTLNVADYIETLLGDHETVEFTQCFRLSEAHASMLGRIWGKDIKGVNPSCEISSMRSSDVVEFLASQNPGDVLCLGARTGDMAETLNALETLYPDKFNKYTVYASIQDNDSLGKSEPDSSSAIFTTFDASKGLERKIAVLFDFSEDYWEVRIRKPQQSYEILRNIICVAASRGKEQIIFVTTGKAPLSERTLSTPVRSSDRFENLKISSMFDFKYKEDIDDCFSLIHAEKIDQDDSSVINIKGNDGLIDITPCIGIYQEAVFFNGYDIDHSIKFHIDSDPDRKIVYSDEMRNSILEQKICFSVAIDTKQNRYKSQVSVPFVSPAESAALQKRLLSKFTRDETVQVECSIDFASVPGGGQAFAARGIADVVRDDAVYELKFVSEFSHEHFLQCACYMVALDKPCGYLWNTRDNSFYKITIPDIKAFMDQVARTVTKGQVNEYNVPSSSAKSVNTDKKPSDTKDKKKGKTYVRVRKAVKNPETVRIVKSVLPAVPKAERDKKSKKNKDKS